MYSEDEERRGLPIRDFLIKLILVIIFVLLLVWLLPMPDLTGINNKIFNANVQEMKNAAISYFTTERLPEKVGDKKTLTLQEMLDMKLLLPFTDKDGNSCDTRNSYVSLEKLETEYEMKVFLSCNEEEDYIIVKLGCYSYCNSAICEKEEEEEEKPSTPEVPKPEVGGPSCVLTIASGEKGTNNWYTSDVVVKFKSKTTTTKGATITGYGIGTTKNYDKATSYKVTKDGTTTVYGYVKDSTGKTAKCSIVVKKDTVKPDCKLGVLSGSKGSNGSYITNVVVGFTSKTDKTSGVNAYGVTTSNKITYNGKDRMTISKNGSYTVYGYVKDAAGNQKSCSVTVKREADETKSVPSCELVISSGKLGTNGWYISDVSVGFKSKTTTNNAKIVAFGLGTKENYNNSTKYTVTKDGKYIVYGYVKDSNGNTANCSVEVKRDATKPNCELTVSSGTLNSNGYYTSNVVLAFKKKTDAMSGVNSYGIGKTTTYANNNSYTIATTGKHTVYGYIKDNAGNTNTCEYSVEKRDVVYEYQYQKNIAAQYSNWSDWTTHTYDPNNAPAFGSYPLIVIEDLGKSTVTEWKYAVGDPVTKTEVVETGKVTEKSCKDYTYYRVTTSTTTTTTYTVSKSAKWVYKGTVSLKGAPTDNLATKYEFVGMDFNRCGSDCTTTPYTTWHKYERAVGKVSTNGNSTTVTTSGITVECSEFEEKETILFNTVTKVVGYSQTRTPISKEVYQYRKKTRTLVKEAYVDYKWSIYNDQTLLDQGYKMNGNKRVAS